MTPEDDRIVAARPLKMKQALDVLPEVQELVPLRHALVGGSREDRDRGWAASERYVTLDTRLADLRGLEARLPELADRSRARTERLLKHSLATLAALERGELAEAARELVAAGEQEERDGNLDAAEAFYRKAVEVGRRPRDRRGEGLALRRLARVHRSRGESSEARVLYRRAFDIAEAMGDREGIVIACQGLGNVHVDLGEWEEARLWYLRGLEVLADEPAGRLHWELYNNMAIVELRTGELDASEAWLGRLREVIEATGDESGRAFFDNGMGQVLLARGRSEEAEAAYRRAIEAAGDPRARTHCLLNLSVSLIRQQRLPAAESVIREAEELVLSHRLVGIIPEVYRNLGIAGREWRDPDAFLFFEQALESCRQYRLPRVQVAATQHEYALWDEAMGRSEEASARLTEALEIYSALEFEREAEHVAIDLARVSRRAASEAIDDTYELDTTRGTDESP